MKRKLLFLTAFLVILNAWALMYWNKEAQAQVCGTGNCFMGWGCGPYGYCGPSTNFYCTCRSGYLCDNGSCQKAPSTPTSTPTPSCGTCRCQCMYGCNGGPCGMVCTNNIPQCRGGDCSIVCGSDCARYPMDLCCTGQGICGAAPTSPPAPTPKATATSTPKPTATPTSPRGATVTPTPTSTLIPTSTPSITPTPTFPVWPTATPTPLPIGPTDPYCNWRGT